MNYFYQKHGAKVPNNSTLALKMFAHLFRATGNDKFLSPCPGMVNWLGRVQLQTGELPYSLEGPRARVHFLCYQYNAFELLDLLDYYRITADEHIVPIVKKLAGYLAGAVTPSGSVRFSCCRNRPEILYYAAAVAAAAEIGFSQGRTLCGSGCSRIRVGTGTAAEGRWLSVLFSRELRDTL